MLFANFMRRSGGEFIGGLAVLFNAALPAEATDTAKPFNRPLDVIKKTCKKGICLRT